MCQVCGGKDRAWSLESTGWTGPRLLGKKDSDGNFKKIDTNFASIFMLLNISANMLKDEIASGIKIENRTRPLESDYPIPFPDSTT